MDFYNALALQPITEWDIDDAIDSQCQTADSIDSNIEIINQLSDLALERNHYTIKPGIQYLSFAHQQVCKAVFDNWEKIFCGERPLDIEKLEQKFYSVPTIAITENRLFLSYIQKFNRKRQIMLDGLSQTGVFQVVTRTLRDLHPHGAYWIRFEFPLREYSSRPGIVSLVVRLINYYLNIPENMIKIKISKPISPSNISPTSAWLQERRVWIVFSYNGTGIQKLLIKPKRKQKKARNPAIQIENQSLCKHVIKQAIPLHKMNTVNAIVKHYTSVMERIDKYNYNGEYVRYFYFSYHSYR